MARPAGTRDGGYTTGADDTGRTSDACGTKQRSDNDPRTAVIRISLRALTKSRSTTHEHEVETTCGVNMGIDAEEEHHLHVGGL